MPIAFLLALQASGMVVDWLGKKEQARMGRMGAEIEQAGIESEIQTTRLQTEEDSLAAMKQLRQNLGTQAAMFAARGVASGAGSAMLFANESVGNFNADERVRRINQLGNEARLKAGKTLSTLHQKTTESKLWNEFGKSVINRVPTSPDAWGQISKGFSKKSGYGFGFTPVGG